MVLVCQSDGDCALGPRISASAGKAIQSGLAALPLAALVSALAVWTLCASGCGFGGLPAHDKDSLVMRVERGLVESGASPRLTACLTKDLDDVLTERDAEAAYADLSSNPDVSEPSLNSVSLLPRHVKASLKEQVGRCKSALVASAAYTPAELDRMLERVGARAYKWRPDFLTG